MLHQTTPLLCRKIRLKKDLANVRTPLGKSRGQRKRTDVVIERGPIDVETENEEVPEDSRPREIGSAAADENAHEAHGNHVHGEAHTHEHGAAHEHGHEPEEEHDLVEHHGGCQSAVCGGWARMPMIWLSDSTCSEGQALWTMKTCPPSTDQDPRHVGWPCMGHHVPGPQRTNKYAAWQACNHCGLRLRYTTKGAGTRDNRANGPPPDQVLPVWWRRVAVAGRLFRSEPTKP